MSSRSITGAMALTLLLSLGVEVAEGADANAQLDTTLGEYNLTREQFVTEENFFALGYHRGLRAASFDEKEVPKNGEDIDAELLNAATDGYAYGLEARDIALTPPPSVVFAAHKAGEIEAGNLQAWASKLDLTAGKRTARAVTVGSGKTAITIPAGTPVDVLSETEIDGVATVIVAFDGVALRVPNPSDAPGLVGANNTVAPDKKVRAKKAAAEGAAGEGKARAKAEPGSRGPVLRDAIVYVTEGKDGGPGPLQSNGQFASRVLKRARELGIADKAGTYVREADRHVPYYLNCYGPTKEGEIGRMGVESPIAGVVARIEARKYFLRGDGLSEEARLAAVPSEIKARFDNTNVLETKPAPSKPKAAKAEPAAT